MTFELGERTTEAIHLANELGPPFDCLQPAPIPSEQFWISPTFQVDGDPVICGDYGHCMIYSNGQWVDSHQLPENISLTVAIQLDENRARLAYRGSQTE